MKLKNIFLLSVATVALTACDDLFEPAIENNQDITKMYTDATFARGIMDNANLVLPYEENPTNTTDVATDDAVSNNIDNNYKKMASQSIWTSQNNPINQWETRYHAIQYLNLFLENADQVQWDYSSEALNEMHKDNYKGNAYALRGLHFFYLLRAHCGMVNGQLMGVPIHLTSEDASSDFNLPDPIFFQELCQHHISGQLKIAPEHICARVLDLMGKPRPEVYKKFETMFKEENQRIGKKQYLIPYLISSHPGSDLKAAIELAEFLHQEGFIPDQVQDFYPTPGTVSTCMYYTGYNPLTMEKVYVPKTEEEKNLQRALLHFHKPENREKVRKALLMAGRKDLIGPGPKALIR